MRRVSSRHPVLRLSTVHPTQANRCSDRCGLVRAICPLDVHMPVTDSTARWGQQDGWSEADALSHPGPSRGSSPIGAPRPCAQAAVVSAADRDTGVASDATGRCLYRRHAPAGRPSARGPHTLHQPGHALLWRCCSGFQQSHPNGNPDEYGRFAAFRHCRPH